MFKMQLHISIIVHTLGNQLFFTSLIRPSVIFLLLSGVIETENMYA